MRVRRGFVVAGLALAVVLAGSGCGEKGSSGGSPAAGGAKEGSGGPAPAAKADTLVGKWKIEKAGGSLEDANVGTVYEFNADGTMVIGGMTKGTYRQDGGKLAVDLSGIKMDVEVELQDGGSTLIYKIVSGDQTFTMKRQ